MKRLVNAMIRKWSSVAVNGTKQSINAFKAFDCIPGPKPLPIIGNKWRYLPLIGEYKIHEMDSNGESNLRKFGKIVREVIDKNLTIVHVFDPKDIESVFRQEGRYPLRRSHRALLKYRSERPERYRSGGLFPENGEDWYRLRKQFQRQLMSATNVSSYVEDCRAITDDLIDYIRTKRDQNQELQDFHNDLYLWSLENTGVLALDSRLGCLNPNLSEESDAKQMIRSAHETNEAVMRTEMTNNWQTSDTRDYRMLVSAQDCMARIVDKYLRLKSIKSVDNERSGSENNTVLTQILNIPNVDQKDVFALTIDLFLAGIDTTAFSGGFALYHLSRNIEAQNRLRDEINSILKSKSDSLTFEKLSQMSYLKACVKETMRLSPVAFGVGRLSARDIIVDDFIIPKGTQIITQNQVSCRQSEHFAEPLAFIPERWLKHNGCPHYSNKTPFLLLPFGYGPRMCIGRRFAEMEIYVLLTRILQNFRIEYHYEEIKLKTRLINVPNRPMRFRFIDILA